MNTTPLSRVEVWQIENVLFKLYRIIQSCVDFIDPDNIGIYELASPITWIDKDTIITEFFEKPQYYEYGEDSAVTLTGDNLFRLRNYIIENQALGVAIDLTEQELNLHSFILFLKNLDEPIYSCLGSIQYLEMLRDFRYEIYKWACFYSNSIGSTIDDEMTKRQEATYLIAENLNELHLKYRPQQKSFILHSDSDDEDAFDLSDYFKSHYDKAKILKIYKQISVLAYEQEDLCPLQRPAALLIRQNDKSHSRQIPHRSQEKLPPSRHIRSTHRKGTAARSLPRSGSILRRTIVNRFQPLQIR